MWAIWLQSDKQNKQTKSVLLHLNDKMLQDREQDKYQGWQSIMLWSRRMMTSTTKLKISSSTTGKIHLRQAA